MKKSLFFIIFIFLVVQCTFAQTTRNYTAILRSDAGTMTLWDGTVIRIYGITQKLSSQPTLPGTVLTANEGDTVIVTARSISQGDHHTIHLHGLDVDTRNDGDPATSFWLSHLQDTTYTFIAHHAGSYFYHCHVGDVVHVQMGMYGLIVVHAAGGAKKAWTGGASFDKEYNWLTSEIDKSWHDNIPKHDSLADTIHLPPYRPNYFLVNGKSHQQIGVDTSTVLTTKIAEKVLLHIGNIGFYGNMIIFPSSLQAMVLMSDGRPLPNAVRTDSLLVFPGERYEVMLQPKTELNDSVRVNYVNMNTHLTEAVEYVPIHVNIQSYTAASKDKKSFPYPNPAKDFCIVAKGMTDYRNISVRVTDRLGRETQIRVKQVNDGFRIDVRPLASGKYSVIILSGDRVIDQAEIVVQH